MFSGCEGLDRGAVLLELFLCVVQEAAALDEGIHAQGAGELRGSRGGQDVVGPAIVVANGFTGVVAQEDTSGVTNLAKPVHGVFHHEFQMFRGDLVGNLEALVHGLAEDAPAIVCQGG